jgi:hypothetical protein
MSAWGNAWAQAWGAAWGALFGARREVVRLSSPLARTVALQSHIADAGA